MVLAAATLLASICTAPPGTSPGASEGAREITNRRAPEGAEDIDWVADLDYLVAVLTRVHSRPFHSISEADFRAAAAALRERIAGLPNALARVELAGLVASLGDGHTRINLLTAGGPGVPSEPEAGFVPLPVRLYAYANGLFVRSASREHADLAGARIVTIGRLPVEEAIERVGRYMHRDNAMTVRLGVPWLLTRPAFLWAIGAIDGTVSVPLTLVTVAGDLVHRALIPVADVDSAAVDAGPANLPLWLQGTDRPYRFELQPGGRTIYLQFNAVVEDEDEPVAAFADRLLRVAAEREAERIVVDLRHNGGGDFVVALPLVDALDRFDADHGAGSLFVAIGRSTFSAAGVFAAMLESRTDAVFVGEPTASKPNTYGDLDDFTLPSSGLSVSYSERFFQSGGPYDERPWIAPDLTAEASSADYAAGRDPVLSAIDAYTPVPRLTPRLQEVAAEGTVEDAVALYRDFRDGPEHRYYWSADALEALGVHYWRRQDWDSALVVWRLLADEQPASSEWLENIVETLAVAGDRDNALATLLRLLRTDPRNPDVVEIVEDLCGPAAVRTFLLIDVTSDEGQEQLRSACETGPGHEADVRGNG